MENINRSKLDKEKFFMITQFLREHKGVLRPESVRTHACELVEVNRGQTWGQKPPAGFSEGPLFLRSNLCLGIPAEELWEPIAVSNPHPLVRLPLQKMGKTSKQISKQISAFLANFITRRVHASSFSPLRHKRKWAGAVSEKAFFFLNKRYW